MTNLDYAAYRQWAMCFDVACWLCRGKGIYGLGRHKCRECYGIGRDSIPWAELFAGGR